jgi:TPR repeat protein
VTSRISLIALLALAFLAAACTPAWSSGASSKCAALGQAGLNYLDAPLDELEKRAACGDKQAALQLGLRYDEGRDIKPDLKKAVRYYAQAAADEGKRTAFYSPPIGKEKNGMIEFDSQPAQPGYPEAMVRLGLMYAQGRGVRKNFNQAENWFLWAASLGDPRAKCLFDKIRQERKLGNHLSIPPQISNETSTSPC